jgi:hypothetical protein
MRSITTLILTLAAGTAMAQTPPGPPDQGAAPPPSTGADQIVGLFGATCLHFAGDAAAMRAWLTQQGAPQMPAAATTAFLAGRAGQVFDASYQNIKLALVSLDDGGCEAVADEADPAQVLAVLQQAASDNHVPLTALGAQPGGAPTPDKPPPGVQHSAFGITLAGKPMHILVSTASARPQAVIDLIPK